jgi:hypothetical protein
MRGNEKPEEPKENPWINRPPMPAQYPVSTASGTYYETCQRCDGHVQLRDKLPPRKPMTFQTEHERDFITGVFGGILPVYREDGTDFLAACSCVIGRYMANQYGFPMYDQLPGSSPLDTKHSIIMAHGNDMLEHLRAERKAA